VISLNWQLSRSSRHPSKHWVSGLLVGAANEIELSDKRTDANTEIFKNCMSGIFDNDERLIFGDLVGRMDRGMKSDSYPFYALTVHPFLHLIGCTLEEGKTVLILDRREAGYVLQLFKLYWLYFGLFDVR
jgi:hypothetical protein